MTHEPYDVVGASKIKLFSVQAKLNPVTQVFRWVKQLVVSDDQVRRLIWDEAFVFGESRRRHLSGGDSHAPFFSWRWQNCCRSPNNSEDFTRLFNFNINAGRKHSSPTTWGRVLPLISCVTWNSSLFAYPNLKRYQYTFYTSFIVLGLSPLQWVGKALFFPQI